MLVERIIFLDNEDGGVDPSGREEGAYVLLVRGHDISQQPASSSPAKVAE